MVNWKVNAFFIVLFVLAVLPPASHATTLRKFTLSELSSSADVIAVGKCERKVCFWKDRKIYTSATIRLEKSLKGGDKPNETVEVRMLGGRVYKPIPIRMQVLGVARVSVGEEMVLFLKRDVKKPKRHRFLGMFQGKFTIGTEKPGNVKRAMQTMPRLGVSFTERDEQEIDKARRIRRQYNERLDVFLARVKTLVEIAEKNSAGDCADSEKPDQSEGGAE